MALNPLLELLKRFGGQLPQTADTRAPIEQVALGSQPTPNPEEAEQKSGLFSSLFPDDPEKKKALGRSLLQGGAAMMMAGGPSRDPTNFLQVLGAGLGTGAKGYDAALESGQKHAAEQVKLKQAERLQQMQSGLFGGEGDNGDLGYSIPKLKQYLQYQIAAGDDAGARDTLGMIQKLQQEAASKGMRVAEDGSLVAADGYNEGLGATEEAKAAGRVQGEEAHRQTDDIREYNLYVEQTKAAGGTAQDFTSWMREGKKAGATNVTVEGNKYGTIPTGYQLVEDKTTGATRMEPVPGGPAELELKQAQEKKDKGKDQKRIYQDVVTNTVDDIFAADADATLPTTGLLGSVTQNIPGTKSYDISQNLSTLKANASFERLTAMREASPTGGALGGVSEKEMALLQDSYAALEQSQSEEQFVRNLNRFNNTYMDVVHGTEAGTQFHRPLDYKGTLPDLLSGKSDKKKDKPVEKDANGAPTAGYEEDGYIFQGGDPSDPRNWIPANLL